MRFVNFPYENPLFISTLGFGRLYKHCYTRLPIVLRNNYIQKNSWHSIGQLYHVFTRCHKCRKNIIYPRCRAFDCTKCTLRFMRESQRILMGTKVEVEPR